MKKLVLLGLMACVVALEAKTPSTKFDAPIIQAYFAPQDNVQGQIVSALRMAKQRIRVQAYLLTDNVISDALIAAHRRGVDVQVLMDAVRAQEAKGSDAQRLKDAGIAVRLESKYENAHNKVIIIDNETLITGSYNFTYTAQYKNAENILLVKQAPQLIQKYLVNWTMHNKLATDYK